MIAPAVRQVTSALGASDVLLCAAHGRSRPGVAQPPVAIARGSVSAALATIVRQAVTVGPAWIVAKGGITSHDVAGPGWASGGTEVAGQLFPA